MVEAFEKALVPFSRNLGLVFVTAKPELAYGVFQQCDCLEDMIDCSVLLHNYSNAVQIVFMLYTPEELGGLIERFGRVSGQCALGFCTTLLGVLRRRDVPGVYGSLWEFGVCRGVILRVGVELGFEIGSF